MSNKEVCTQCPRQCPITELRCGRGRAALQGDAAEHEHSSHHKRKRVDDISDLKELLGECGHYCRHKRDGKGQHNEKKSTDMFAALSEQEQKELDRLLRKLLKSCRHEEI